MEGAYDRLTNPIIGYKLNITVFVTSNKINMIHIIQSILLNSDRR